MNKFVYIFIVPFFIYSCSTSRSGSSPSNGSGKNYIKGNIKEIQKVTFESLYADGMKYYMLGSFGDAKSAFEKALQVDQENAAASYMLAKILLSNNENGKAIQYATKAYKKDSKNKYYAILLAKAYEQSLNAAEAIKVYKKMLVEIPGTEEYYYDLANLYMFERNYTESIKTYSAVEDIFGKSLELTRQKQQLFIRMDNLKEAIREGEALMKAFPEDMDIKTAHAEFLNTNKLEDDAIALLKSVTEAEPNHARAHLLLADIYQSKGELDKANEELNFVFSNPEIDLNTKLQLLEAYLSGAPSESTKKSVVGFAEKILKTHPDQSKSYAALGEAHLYAGNKEEAWKAFILAKNRDNSTYSLWQKLIALDGELNKTDSMIKHTEQALELYPNQPSLWLYNGNGYSMKKNYARAIDAYEEGKKLSAGNIEMSNYFNMYLGDTYHYIKEYEKSDKAYQEVLKNDKNNYYVLNNYSYFLSLRKEKLDEAKEMAERVVRKFPNEPSYVDTYAWVLYVMKDYKGALEQFERIAINSKNGTIVEHYGDALFQTGQIEKAVEQWIRAKKLGETSEFIDKKIADKKLYE